MGITATNMNNINLLLLLIVCLLSLSNKVQCYKNYTVGDSMGWYDTGVKPGVDYQKWASGKSFSLGDFLIFNTDNNRSVSQTYNPSTYKSCDSSGEDVTLWSNSAPSSTAVYPVTVPVPLLKEGTTYFFSGDYDGDECKAGQRFQINVTHGKGLPPALAIEYNLPTSSSSSAAAAPGPAEEPDSGDDNNNGDESGTHTPLSADFSHPKNDTSSSETGKEDEDSEGDDETKRSAAIGSLVAEIGFFVRLFNIVILIGVSYLLL